MIWLMSVLGAMSVAVAALIAKVVSIQSAAREIERSFIERLATDTNTLIDVSCGDKYMRSLANTINTELRELRRLRHRFEQGDAELKNAITGISHDIRTPLTAICGYLDMLDNEQKSFAAEKYITIIKNRVGMLEKLTDELFLYSIVMAQENSLAKKPVVINSILEESIASFYILLKENNIEPNINITKKNIVRNIDAGALARVFANLISNAVKYSDGDLLITLQESGEIVFLNTAKNLGNIELARLFDRFYTLESARKSTGLGLSIAKTLTMQMGGSIQAEYFEGKLRISIIFPE